MPITGKRVVMRDDVPNKRGELGYWFTWRNSEGRQCWQVQRTTPERAEAWLTAEPLPESYTPKETPSNV